MSPAGPFCRAHGAKYWICEYDTCRQECDAFHDYCRDHGCEWPIQDAPASVPPRCNALRSENPAGGLFTMCSRHRCKDPTCGAPAALAVNSEYCRAHTCHAAFCREEVARESATDPFTSYCRNHQCRQGDCAELRVTTLNPNPKDASQYRTDGSGMGYGYHQFCPKHSCLIDDCLDMAVVEGLGSGLGYCEFHVASWENVSLGD